MQPDDYIEDSNNNSELYHHIGNKLVCEDYELGEDHVWFAVTQDNPLARELNRKGMKFRLGFKDVRSR